MALKLDYRVCANCLHLLSTIHFTDSEFCRTCIMTFKSNYLARHGIPSLNDEITISMLREAN